MMKDFLRRNNLYIPDEIKKSKKTPKNHCGIILEIGTIFLIVISFVLIINSIITSSLKNVDTQLEESKKEISWNFVQLILENSYKSADDNITTIGINIKHSILRSYNLTKEEDVELLKNDIKNPSPDSRLASILNDNCNEKYFMVENENNNIIIANNDGIIFDKSLHTSYDPNSDSTNVRLWKDYLYDNHINDNLTCLAYKTIKKELNYPYIFIEHKPYGIERENHELATDMTINEIERIYKKEGMEGLKNYEFLVPYYITETGDIFGKPDVSEFGIKNDNFKLIIIQKFSLYDIVNISLDDEIFTYDISTIQKNMLENRAIISIVVKFFTIISIILFLVLIKMVHEYICKQEDIVKNSFLDKIKKNEKEDK